jgi:hypothetical protein
MRVPARMDLWPSGVGKHHMTGRGEVHFSTICAPHPANFRPSTSVLTRRAEAQPEPPQACLFIIGHPLFLSPPMSKLHDFLVEHAKFPFPPLNDDPSSSTTDISTLDVNLLEIEWKVKLAVRDDTLVQKLCGALEAILGDAPLAEGAENYLLASFSPRIQFDERGREDEDWSTNSSETHVSVSRCSSLETEQFRADPGSRVGGC